MTSIPIVNHQIRLVARPNGLPLESDFCLTEEPVPQLAAGELLVKVSHVSLDPAMRGWMDDRRSYVPPVGIDEVMRAFGAGEVVGSEHPLFAVGDVVTGIFGVQEYAVSDGSGVLAVDTEVVPLPTYLSLLGLTGLTAYFGLFDVGVPREGETVLVSGAAGATGHVVGQLARIAGCRVVGIAGGPEKCAWLTDELGFDACVDYREPSLGSRLAQATPDGVDVFFDNVGGDVLDAGLARLTLGARVVLCGAISQYNTVTPVGPSNYLSLLINRARMQGFLVTDYAERFADAAEELAGWAHDGRLRSREDVVDGSVADFPATLLRLFRGDNIGKLLRCTCGELLTGDLGNHVRRPGDKSVKATDFEEFPDMSVNGPSTTDGYRHVATFCNSCGCGCPELFVDESAPAERRIVITDDFGQRIQMSIEQLHDLVTDVKGGVLDALLVPAGA